MLLYLQNRKNNVTSAGNPSNENYAREFLELFTIGRGEQEASGIYSNYTETDINEFALLLTGFKIKSTRNGDGINPETGSDIDPETGIRTGYAYPYHHASRDKTFSNKLGNATITGRSDAAGMMQELEDFIDVVFNQAETARNYARKIYRYYVNTKIDESIESAIIQPLANHLTANNFNLVASIKYLLKSEHFYEMCTFEGGGNIIKSPIELLAETMSFFNTDMPSYTDGVAHFKGFINKFLFGTNHYSHHNVDRNLFIPADPAGYPAYYQEPLRDKNWYNITTKPYRYNLSKYLISNPHYIANVHYTYLDTVAYANYLQDVLGVDVGDADAMVDTMIDYLLPQSLSAERRDIIKNIFLDDLSEQNWQCEWGLYHGDGCIVAPNIPPDGDETRVRGPLDALVIAVLSSQEFQLK